MSPHKINLTWHNDRTPVSTRFGDVYFSPLDGLAETRHVFLAGCQLPDIWQERQNFTIGETGFGTGLNFLAAWDLWQKKQTNTNAWLDYGSVELYPLARSDLARTNGCWPELAPLAAKLYDFYPEPTPGFHRLVFPQDRVRLTLMIGDAAQMLAQWTARVDAWFLDGFSPARNPDMWRPAVMAQLARLSRKGTRLASFTVARAVRDGLAENGFSVQKTKGFAYRTDMIQAVYQPDHAVVTDKKQHNIAIIGGGIAGAAIAHSLQRRGCTVTVFDRLSEPAMAASGNPVAMVMPKLQLGTTPMADFQRAVFRYARQIYAPQGGVLQLAGNAAAATRLEKLVAENLVTDQEAVFLTPDQVNDCAGLRLDKPALWLSQAGWVRPREIVKNLMTGATWSGNWTGNFDILDDYDLVVMAGGLGSLQHPDLAHLPLRYRKGQITYLKPTTKSLQLRCCVTEGRYLLPAIDGAHVLGATFDAENNIDADDDADRRNLAHLATMIPALNIPTFAVLGHRAGMRATTPDHLPFVGRVNEKLAVLTGLGSSGFTTAPLCAEILAAILFDEALPVASSVVARLSPNR